MRYTDYIRQEEQAVKNTEYQCPKCSAVIPKRERMQFTDYVKGESIMVCIDCFDTMTDEVYAAKLAGN